MVEVKRSPMSAKTILCIDDEEGMRKALDRLLRSISYRVITAPSGEEGLHKAREEHPDLIFLDVRMPGMDGFATLTRLREEGLGRIPVVMLTAEGSEESSQRGYREGSVYYITKPFKNDYVCNIVEYLIGDPNEERRALLETKL